MTSPRLSPAAQQALRCPRCHAGLALEPAAARCTGGACGLVFPVEGGVPLLLDEQKSVFSAAGVLRDRHMPSSRPASPLKQALAALIPPLGKSPNTRANFRRLRGLLAGAGPARVLVVGGGVLGVGVEALAGDPAVELVETDVFLGPRTALVCDAHDLPFADASFDGAVIQAVLEHVVDPARCVAELHRVLKPGGLVYAETPFMQQVHLGRFDFTRFSHLGHRRLFRRFEELESGACGGPGMALAWAWQHFLVSLVRGRAAQALARAVSAFTAWPLTWLDPWLIGRPAALDAASGVYFLGRRSERTLPDRELIAGYRGAL